MRRNPNSQSGVINWPTHLENTGEGGMFVYAIVPYIEAFQKCCGVSCGLIKSECLMDPDPNAGDIDPVTQKQFWPLEDKIFPRINDNDDSPRDIEKYISCDLLAAICLGSCGGSFWDKEKEKYWTCTTDDLTAEGKRLVDMLKSMYGDHVQFLTFLDT